MPQATGSAPRPAPTKTLVRGSDGKKYLIINPTEAPVQVDSDDHPDPELRKIINDAEDALTKHFNSLGSQSLASGVKIGFTQVF